MAQWMAFTERQSIDMATVYLHVGTMKTGTSAIQAFMGQNREIFAEKGYCYPRLELGLSSAYIHRNAQFLIWDSLKNTRVKDLEKERDVRAKGYEQLQQKIEGFDKVVLSEETIWNRCRRIPDFWKNVVQDFRAIGCELKVIVYLRKQDDLVESLWNQGLKTRNTKVASFSGYIKRKGYSYCPLDYYQQLKEIESYIGKENLIVRVYEKGQYEGEGKTIYSDFLKCIGLPYEDIYTVKKDANLGLCGNFIEIKRIVNSVPEYQELSDFMAFPLRRANNQQVLDGAIPKMTMFSPEERAEFMAQFEESNRKVAREYLQREDGTLFHQTSDNIPQWAVNQDTIYRDMIAFMTQLICEQEKRMSRLEQEIGMEKEKMKELSPGSRVGQKLKRMFKKA